MSDDDIMFEIVITLARGGRVAMRRDTPSGGIFSDKVIALGLLEVAKAMVASELKPEMQEPQK
jgi:hypothetical protein